MGGFMDRKLRKEWNAIQIPKSAQARLDETVTRCHAVYHARRKMRSIGSFEIIIRQLRFMAKPIWALQAAVILCMCFLLQMASGTEEASAHLSAVLSLASVFVAMTILPFYGRSRKYKMREIESAARLSHTKLMLAKLCTAGVGDVICLAVLSVFSFGKMTGNAETALAYIVAPFLLACSGILLILNHTKEDCGALAALGFGAGLAAACWLLPVRFGNPLARLGAGALGIACAVMLLILLTQCRRLLRQTPVSDLQEAPLYD
jgi:hypothetical protein